MEVTIYSEIIPGCKSFTWNDLIHSSTANLYNIKNIPNEKYIFDNLQYLAISCLQPLRDYFNKHVTIVSCYRNKEINDLVSGDNQSLHLIGAAVDVNIKGINLFDIFDFFYNRQLFTELVLEEYPDGWIHIAMLKEKEKELITKYKLVNKLMVEATYDVIKNIFKINETLVNLNTLNIQTLNKSVDDITKDNIYLKYIKENKCLL